MFTSAFSHSFRSGVFRFATAFVLATAFGLSGCSELKTVDDNIQEGQVTAAKSLEALEPKTPIAQPLTIDKRPYYGSQAIPIANGSPLPPQFEQSGAVVMTFARPVTVNELARMIQSVTGVRTVAHASVNKSGGSGEDASGATAKTFVPTDGEQVAGGRVVWQGRLSDLLNQAADAFEADWRYDGSNIEFAQQITRTYMLNALASEMSVGGSVTSGTSEDGGNLPSLDVKSTTSMKVWDEIKEAVDTIVGDGGKTAFSPSTGTITVSASPDVVRRVEGYLNQQNSMRLRRVAIAVKILSVTAATSLDLTSDVTGIIKRAFDQASLRSVGTATAGVTIGVLKAPDSAGGVGTTADSTAIDSDRLLTAFKADKEVKKASVVHSGALVTLSDQPAPLQVGRQISYVKRVSSSGTDSTGTSLEAGTINTGLMMTVLPRIVDGNKILMRVSAAITSTDKVIPTFASGGVTIQLPEIDTTGFLQNAVMTSGETMVLAGFEKNDNASTNDGTPDAFLLGGTKASSRSREITVLVLTAEILPEDPITVIGN